MKSEGVAKGIGKESRARQPTPKGQAAQPFKACLGVCRIRKMDKGVPPVPMSGRAWRETDEIKRSLKPRTNQKAFNIVKSEVEGDVAD